MIHQRQSSDKVERHDLLTSLLDANNEDFSNQKLLDSELIGNIYIFLLAGHEVGLYYITCILLFEYKISDNSSHTELRLWVSCSLPR